MNASLPDFTHRQLHIFRDCTRGLLISLSLFPCVLLAGEILDSSVTHDGAVYRLSITARVNAPLAVVYQSITDFTSLAAINPSIEESQVLESQGANRLRVRSVIRVCILVFCKRVVQVQDVTLVDSRTVVATMVPGAGDFRAGSARWELTAVGTATQLHFTEAFEPDFWVPPVIGPWLIEKKLVREVAETAMYIEMQAGGQ
jgi:carbon monoxide dehydrogenase subunit G